MSTNLWSGRKNLENCSGFYYSINDERLIQILKIITFDLTHTE